MRLVAGTRPATTLDETIRKKILLIVGYVMKTLYICNHEITRSNTNLNN